MKTALARAIACIAHVKIRAERSRLASRYLKRGFFAAVAGLLSMPQPTFSQHNVLVMGATGGSYEAVLKEHIFDPFSKETGIKVVFISGSIAERWAKVEAMSKSGNFEWDMMESTGGDVYNPNKNKYLVDLGDRCELVPKAYEDGLPTTCNRYGVLPGVGATQLTVNTKVFGGDYPKTWADMWNIKKYPGPRTLQNFGEPWRLLLGALHADGVPKDKLFPMDLDRAFKKLDEIKPHVSIWWSSGDQVQRAFRQQEAVMGQIWGTRLAVLRAEGLPLKPLWDGATPNESRWVVFKNAPHKETALKFLNWLFDHPEAQYAYARKINLTPVTKSATALFSPEQQVDQAGHPDNIGGILPIDYNWIAEHEARINERWNAWIAR